MGVNCLIFGGNTEYSFKMISAGPYRIATQLRQSGFTVQVVDVSYYRKFNSAHKAILKKFVDKDTLWIGFSVNYMNHILGFPYRESRAELEYLWKINPNLDIEIKKFIEFSKDLNSNLEFVIGGVRLFDLSHLGFFEFRGHTDENIVEFTKELSKGNKPNNKIIRNDEYKKFTTSKIFYLKNDILNTYKSLPLEVSRGCIFKCKFCSFALNGKTKGEWIKNTEVLKEELIYNYENYGITDYTLTDDTYNDSVDKITALHTDVFSKIPFKITFGTYLRADLMYRFPHTVDIMVESGLREANLGLETLNKSAAKIIGKGTDPYLLIEMFQKLKEKQFKNVVTFSSWILGLPGDTKKSMLEFYNWIISEENPINNNKFSPLGVRPPNVMDFYMYRSAFDLDYEKTCKLEFYMSEHGRWLWKSTETDLDMMYCIMLRDEHGCVLNGTKRKLRSNDRIGGRFQNSSLISLGIDFDDIIQMPAKDALIKNNISLLSQQQNLNYIKNLLTL